MSKIGIVGLGKIGLPIARHLIAAGDEVIGYRRSCMADFEALGGKVATSASEVAERAETVLTCVSGDAAMDEVVEGLKNTARPDQVFVCLSSHSVSVKQGYADILGVRGAVLLDAEVSGTPGMVEARRASVYLAGPEDKVRLIEQVIGGFAAQSFYLGSFGSATKVKLLNNFLVALDIAGTAQAMAIGLKMGIDPGLMIDAVGKGSGSSTQFNIRAPWMADRKFSPVQGAPAVLLSYLESVHLAGTEVGASVDLIENLIAIYRRAIPVVGDRDVAAMLELFESSKTN